MHIFLVTLILPTLIQAQEELSPSRPQERYLYRFQDDPWHEDNHLYMQRKLEASEIIEWTSFVPKSCHPICGPGTVPVSYVWRGQYCPKYIPVGGEREEFLYAAPPQFCDANLTKVCTYCIDDEFLGALVALNGFECEVTKPKNCNGPKDLKFGKCKCRALN